MKKLIALFQQIKSNPVVKRILYFLQKSDGVWSVPLGFFIFYAVGCVLTYLFGYGTGAYDPSFIQPLFLAAVVVVGATNAATLGLFFTVRGFHRFLYGHKTENEAGDKVVENDSKHKWNQLTPLQQFIISLSALAFFIIAILIVYLKLV